MVRIYDTLPRSSLSPQAAFSSIRMLWSEETSSYQLILFIGTVHVSIFSLRVIG